MKELPFEPYDFFGYIASGLVLVAVSQVTLGFPRVFGADLKAFDMAVTVLAVYIAGQIMAGPAKACFEDILVQRLLGSPTRNLLYPTRRRLLKMIFPGFYKPLPPGTRAKLASKIASTAESGSDPEDIFLAIRYAPEVLASESLIAKINTFRNQYGFARNVSFSLLIAALCFAAFARDKPSGNLIHYSVAAFGAGMLLFYRYLKFFANIHMSCSMLTPACARRKRPNAHFYPVRRWTRLLCLCNYPKRSQHTFDCGFDSDLDFYPSRYFADRKITEITRLILSHFDQDHVSDLPRLRAGIHFGSIVRNRSVPVEFINREKKQNGIITGAMASAIEMHQKWTNPAPEPVWGGVKVTSFCNPYGSFTDTSNLSLVTFLEYDGFGIVIPGDLERAGWEKLLKIPEFANAYGKPISSSHRITVGLPAIPVKSCYCNPKLVILSDKNIVHETQEHDYTKHALGVPWNGCLTQRRYVLTTRKDGNIRITKEFGKGFQATTGITL